MHRIKSRSTRDVIACVPNGIVAAHSKPLSDPKGNNGYNYWV